jgi:membrane protease YdiL (CAAX protease family)
MSSQTKRQSSITVYFILACAISWAFMVPAFVISEQRGYVLPTPSTISEFTKTGFQDSLHILLYVIGVLSTFGPMLAAIILAGMEGRLGEWWKRTTNWHMSGRGYRDLLVMFLAIFLPLILVGLLLGSTPTLGLLAISAALPYLLLELLSGFEEPGWRGYALPKLQEKFSAKKSSLILGLVWGLWHWPAFIPLYFKTLAEPGTPVIAAFITAAISAVMYALSSILAAAFIHSWLYNRTGSAVSNFLLHGGSNAIGGTILVILPNPALGMVYGFVRWIVAIVLMRFFWKEARVPEIGQVAVQPQSSGL